MHPSAILQKLPLMAAIASAAPSAENSELLAPVPALEARSGWHKANVYSGSGCSGNTLGQWEAFGCGGTCRQVDSSIWSILLSQENVGNPVPTASLFYGNNCEDGTQVASAGIFTGEHSGCTNLKAPARSLYLYWDCHH